ncbi:MAG: hypothetical protein QX192_03705 [Methylococcales bacterium]
MNHDIFEQFKAIRAYKENDKFSVHKPILLLYALSQCNVHNERLLSFHTIDKAFAKCFERFNFEGVAKNSHYPFGKLENDEIWEVENSKRLKRTSAGHLHKKQLIDENICGGFTQPVYAELAYDGELIKKITNHILTTYIDRKIHDDILLFFNLPNKNQGQNYGTNWK